MDLKNLFGYEGKTVVVSGAYSGMGLAAARLLHELGANVYTICRRNGRHSKLDFPVAGELYADFGVKADLDALADALPNKGLWSGGRYCCPHRVSLVEAQRVCGHGDAN